jgi:hypothetical protein
LLWIIGGITVTVLGLGCVYCYNYVPVGDGLDPNILARTGERIVDAYVNIKTTLNPWTWVAYIKNSIFDNSTPTAETLFKARQNELATFDNRFYPFTNNDPFKPWYHRLRISLFGESVAEIDQRIFDKNFALREAINVLDRKSGLLPSGINTPAGLGLILHLDPSIYPEWANVIRTERILSRLPQTPVNMPEFINDWINSKAGPSGSRSPAITIGVLSQTFPVAKTIPLDTILETNNEWNKPDHVSTPSDTNSFHSQPKTPILSDVIPVIND